MPPVSLLIKPSSSLCQMRCTYCFYHSLAENRSVPSYGIMSLDTLETVVRKALENAEGTASFAFQGGEPTMAGLDFFKAAMEYQQKYNIHKVRISNVIQTNGYILDESWVQFFAEHQFLVGLSMDGPPELHDKYRPDASGKGTSKRVLSAMKLMDRYQVPYNILTVLTAETARQPEKIYRYYKKMGLGFLQFIPCLDPFEENWGKNRYSLKPDAWEYFHKGLFDVWYRDFMEGHYISIRYFDNLVHILLGHGAEACSQRGHCSCQCVVESDGSVYPCDFYVVDEWKLGNLKECSLQEVRESERAKQFIEVSLHKDPKCESCRWKSLCRGGCRREREYFREPEAGPNHYCEAYQHFFEYTYDRLVRAARYVQQVNR